MTNINWGAMQKSLGIQDKVNSTPTTTKPVVETSTKQSSFSGVDLLPAALGTAGMVGGKYLGGAAGAVGGEVVEPAGGGIPGEVIGSKAGSALLGGAGQALGEYLRELIKSQPISGGEIAKQGLQGIIWGLAPEGGKGGFAKKAITRSAIGAGTMAAAQGVEEIGNKQPGGGQRVKQAAETGAIAGPVIGAGTDALASGAKFLRYINDKMGSDLSGMQGRAGNKMKEITTAMQHWWAGVENADYFQKQGLIPKGELPSAEGLKTSLSKTKDLQKVKAQELSSKLSGIKVSLGDTVDKAGMSIKDTLMRAVEAVPYGKGKLLQSMLGNIFSKAFSKPNYPLELMSNELQNNSVSLDTLNEAKQAIGKFYTSMGEQIPEVYNHIQTYIEQKSGKPDIVHGLNQEQLTLMKGRDNIEKVLSGNSLPAKFSKAAINHAVTKAASGDTTGLQLFVGGASLIGMMAGHPMLAGAGMAGAFGLRSVVSSLVKIGLENPEMVNKIISVLKMGSNAYSGAEKALVSQALNQLGQKAILQVKNKPTTSSGQ